MPHEDMPHKLPYKTDKNLCALRSFAGVNSKINRLKKKRNIGGEGKPCGFACVVCRGRPWQGGREGHPLLASTCISGAAEASAE